MGENYTRKTENYSAARQERRPNAQGSQQTQKSTNSVFTCWKCHLDFELPGKPRPDTVRCPHDGMIHGLITSAKDN